MAQKPDKKALQQEKEKRQGQIAWLEQYLINAETLIIKQIQKDMVQFARYGLEMDTALAEKPFASLKDRETMASILDRHYDPGDRKCMEIMALEEGAAKQRKMKEFGDNILLEGVECLQHPQGYSLRLPIHVKQKQRFLKR